MILCVCRGVSESKAREAIQKGECSMKNLRCKTGVGTQCGICRKSASQLVLDVQSSKKCESAIA